MCTFCLYGLKDCSLIFDVFHVLIGLVIVEESICAGQGNTIVSHFVVQRADFSVGIACVPCGPRRSLIYACE